MQMKTSLTIGIIALSLAIVSCKKKGCTDVTAENYAESAEKDDGSCTYATEGTITFDFTQNFGGTNVTAAGFDQLNYTNANGEVFSITKMRYSISDVRFYLANGDSLMLDGYHLIDMADEASLTYVLPESIPFNSFVGIGFTYGFDEADNTDGAYTDLNAANWNSPMMLGGGYHQLQFEGRYIDNNTDTTSFAYHNISTSRQIIGTDTTFVANHANINLSKSFTFSKDATIEIEMDISEWFQNPNTWDLNVLYMMLMGNHSAQVQMTENSKSVFSVGTVSE